MNRALHRIADKLTGQPDNRLPIDNEAWVRINPLYLIMAHLLVRNVDSSIVREKLKEAKDFDSLRALFLVDCFLSLVRDPHIRHHLEHSLMNEMPANEVAMHAALSLAQDAIAACSSLDEDERPQESGDLLFSLDDAARILGISADDLSKRVLKEELPVTICMSSALLASLCRMPEVRNVQAVGGGGGRT